MRSISAKDYQQMIGEKESVIFVLNRELQAAYAEIGVLKGRLENDVKGLRNDGVAETKDSGSGSEGSGKDRGIFSGSAEASKKDAEKRPGEIGSGISEAPPESSEERRPRPVERIARRRRSPSK